MLNIFNTQGERERQTERGRDRQTELLGYLI